jgi:uncharacterized membrane protein
MGVDNFYLFGISADGSTLAGVDYDENGGFNWTQQGGLQIHKLPPPLDFYQCKPVDISADGSVVVGETFQQSGQSFVWSAPTGVMRLEPSTDGIDSTVVNAISGDGSVVVGRTYGTSKAWIWDFEHGTRNLENFLITEHGLGETMSGWHLFDATAVSADGRTIVGYGRNPQSQIEGWIAFLGTPVVRGDFNRDGVVTGADVQTMLQTLADLNAYKSGSGTSDVDLLTIGDINGDLLVNNADLQGLLNLLKSGGGSAAAVPEPSTLPLACCGLVIAALTALRLLTAPRRNH